ncbi:MAG: O-antigen ligase family protein [Thermoleophilia bacterium]
MDISRRLPCSAEALVLALCVPLLCIHERYNPDFSLAAGSTSVSVALSDVAVLIVLIAAARAARRLGIEPLRRGGWTLAAAGTLIGLVIVGTLLGPLLTVGYPLPRSLVSAAKFAEYGALAVAVPLIVRRRADALAVAVALTAVAALATAVGILQIIGLLGNLDDVPPGRRMPSFVGLHDFAALAGVTLGIAIAAIASGTWHRLRALGAVAAVAGVVGVVIAGAMATVLALMLGGLLAFAMMVMRRTISLRRVLAIAGLLLAVTIGSLSLRSGDVADFVGFLGTQDEQRNNVQSYSQRTVLAAIGVEIFLAHPLTGVGWQASELPVNFEPHLDAVRHRFPEVADEALPSDRHRWGIQNAYIQSAADLGILGLVALLATVATALARAGSRAIRGASPPGPLALGIAIGILVCAAEWAALGLVPGITATALLWLLVGGAVALPRGGDLPDDDGRARP